MITNKIHDGNDGNVGNHADILETITDNDLLHHSEQIQRVFVGGFKWEAKLIHFVRHGKCPTDIVVGQHVVAAEISVDGWDFVSFLLIGGDTAHAKRGDFERALFDEFRWFTVEEFQRTEHVHRHHHRDGRALLICMILLEGAFLQKTVHARR